MGILHFRDGGGVISASTLIVRASPSWVLLVGAAVAAVLLSMLYGSMRRKYSNLPPGPRNWPVIGAMLAMEPQTHKAFEKLAKWHGPIVYLRLGVQPLVVVSSAEVAEEVLKQKDGLFSDRATLMTKTASKYCGFEGRVSAYTDDDVEQNLQRKIAYTEFFTSAKLKTSEELRRQEVAVMVEKLFDAVETTSKSNADPRSETAPARSGGTLFVRDLFVALMRNVIFALVIGERFDRLSPTNHLREFPEIFDEQVRLFMAFNVVDLLPFLTWFDPQGLLKDFKKFGKKQNEFYEKIVRDRRQLRQLDREGKTRAESEVTESNFVDVLLDFQDQGEKISDNTIYGTLTGILSAGIDTTATQAEWIMLELMRHPEVMDRLQAEVDGVVGKDRPVDETDVQIQNMPFLNAVVLEAIRLHPIVPLSFPHCNKDSATTLAGYTIPANTAVVVNIYGIARDPKGWKDPLQFNPERFLGAEREKIKANGTNYNLLAFGSGRRGCVGYNLAWILLLRAIASLVHAFDWSPPPRLSAKDISIEESGNFFLYPKPDLYLTPKPRVSSSLYDSKILV